MRAIDKSSRHPSPEHQPGQISHNQEWSDIAAAAARVRKRFGPVPKMALLLGSGLDGLTDWMRIEQEIPYESLPGFTQPKVQGHKGRLLRASWHEFPLLVFCGRHHFYEGGPVKHILYPVRLASALGVVNMVFTNASGSLKRQWKPGNWMRISDHINFTGFSPLRESPAPDSPNFLSMTDAYDPELGKLLDSAAKKSRVTLFCGVYAAVAGPNYETPAEIRAFQKLGADAIGMSTVPEVIAARQAGIRVAAIACLTNFAAGIANRPLSHAEVLETGRKARGKLAKILSKFFQSYDATNR